MHGAVNAEPGMAPLHMKIPGRFGPVKGADMHAADQNPASCTAKALKLSLPHALLNG